MDSARDRIRWRRVAWMAALLAVCAAFALYGYLAVKYPRLVRQPSPEQFQTPKEAQSELDGAIAWLNHEGVPTTSLGTRCDASSPDAIQVLDSSGGSLLKYVHMAISLHGDRLKSVTLHFGSGSHEYLSADAVVNADQLRSIWKAADQIAATMPHATAYRSGGTEPSAIALEVCKNGRYTLVVRFSGTGDPDGLLVRFDDALWSLSAAPLEH